jgi:cell wall-associated NlpC family hydrolase
MFYFDSQEKQQELKTILDSWIRTPYRHWAGVKGMGTDCIHFVIRVMEETKAVNRKINIPRYPRDWHLHNTEERLLNGILKQLNVDEINVDCPINGDIVLFQFGKTVSHAGIFFNNHVYQAINDVGVEKIHWKEKMWHKRRRHAFRMVNV